MSMETTCVAHEPASPAFQPLHTSCIWGTPSIHITHCVISYLCKFEPPERRNTLARPSPLISSHQSHLKTSAPTRPKALPPPSLVAVTAAFRAPHRPHRPKSPALMYLLSLHASLPHRQWLGISEVLRTCEQAMQVEESTSFSKEQMGQAFVFVWRLEAA